MRRGAFLLSLCSFPLLAQRDSKDVAPDLFASILNDLAHRSAAHQVLSGRLADAMLKLAPPERTPSRTTVLAFTDPLTLALMGLDTASALPRTWLYQYARELFAPEGTNLAKASRLAVTLKRLRLQDSVAHKITGAFIKIGEEVHGPDDMQVLPDFQRSPRK